MACTVSETSLFINYRGNTRTEHQSPRVLVCFYSSGDGNHCSQFESLKSEEWGFVHQHNNAHDWTHHIRPPVCRMIGGTHTFGHAYTLCTTFSNTHIETNFPPESLARWLSLQPHCDEPFINMDYVSTGTKSGRKLVAAHPAVAPSPSQCTTRSLTERLR